MKIAIVYTSKTGNTEELVYLIRDIFIQRKVEVMVYRVEQFQDMAIDQFDAMIVATYTWGNGEIPYEMMNLYHAFETQNVKHVVTGVAGTGDSGYEQFCGAVDQLRDMLYVHTTLAATLKIEITPQSEDIKRCKKFVDLLLERVTQERLLSNTKA
ncbi:MULTISPECIES: flavodoxin domain-containing protein [Neobacillus]|jgi:flavodoxin I|uniref:flavodoxin domain-containing protein n=1 Tax=Neobacillus TaxID=2675232 RepID=UPI0004F81B6E|nr:flavodoxin domain-containing protein [Neobacillus sedimentimangrovi]AIM15200.1 flavodoxin [Bacillus sp. X1(2014)]